MSNIITRLCSTCASLCSAVEHSAGALNAIAKWAEDEAIAMEEAATANRAIEGLLIDHDVQVEAAK